MVLAPGTSTILSVEFTMPEGMGGKHKFLVRLATNDPARPELKLTVLSNWVP
jgi:hypothetical protein